MRLLDASAIIFAWDNYPFGQFPGLWGWIEGEISAQRIVISQVAFEEVGLKIPECARWLDEAEIGKIAVNNEVLNQAMEINRLLGIENDGYHPDGVDENDVFIIATAKCERMELISNESRQARNPKSNNRLKIPAVCRFPEVRVTCLDFVELIKESGQIF